MESATEVVERLLALKRDKQRIDAALEESRMNSAFYRVTTWLVVRLRCETRVGVYSIIFASIHNIRDGQTRYAFLTQLFALFPS